MKRIIWLIVILLLFQSCADVMQSDCRVDNPVEDLEWLKMQTEPSTQSSFIYLVQGRYKGRTVFFFNSCDPIQPTLQVVQDCRGELVEEASANDVQNQRVIWRSENSVCNLE